jgi:YD repeat-containing protein
MTDREKAGLRGPVKSCVEETEKRLTTTEYGVDGRLLTTRTSNADSGWVTTKTYDADGRLAKEAWTKPGQPTTETLFAHDEAGKLKEIRVADGKGNLTTSRYDQQGRWTTYDASGRIVKKKPIEENPAPTSGTPQLNDKRLEAMNKAIKSMMSGKRGTGSSFTHDSQGRVIELRNRTFDLDTVTTTSYNEHGDIREERVTQTSNLAHPELLAFSIGEDGTIIPDRREGDPPPDLERTTRIISAYRYEYDQNGNWTERTASVRVDSSESGFVSGGVDRRTLTYF